MGQEMLINKKDVIPSDIFLNGKHGNILKIIRDKATIENPTVERKKDRDLIISTSAKVASSKTFLEKIGKKLADDKRAKIDKELSTINSTRREIKETLDDLKAEVRKPVTDWENKRKEEKAEKQRVLEYDNDHIAAIAENVLVDHQRKLAEENKRLKKEAEKRQIEEQARINAEKKVEIQRLEGLRREQETKDKLERAEHDKIIAEENRVKAEKQAEIDKQTAIDNLKKEAENEAIQKEHQRLLEENRIKQGQIKLENDRANRKAIGREVLNSLVENGISEDCAKSVIVLVAQGKIKNMKIEYY